MRDQFFIKSAEVLTEEEYLAIPKGRSRSKSSSAIFGFDNLSEMGDTLDPIPDISSSIWGSRRGMIFVDCHIFSWTAATFLFQSN